MEIVFSNGARLRLSGEERGGRRSPLMELEQELLAPVLPLCLLAWHWLLTDDRSGSHTIIDLCSDNSPMRGLLAACCKNPPEEVNRLEKGGSEHGAKTERSKTEDALVPCGHRRNSGAGHTRAQPKPNAHYDTAAARCQEPIPHY
uniref:Uncharacterized protein n=1 Tax=Knipowitschia caucasica TaxID=637954 RepID=A0AAV2LDE7_KNICA